MSNDPGANSAHLTAGLRSVVQDLDILRSQFDAGEPRPDSLSLRARVSLFFKRRLYRLLWWQTAQIRSVVELLARWSHEEVKAFESLARRVTAPDPGISQRERDFESRLQWLAATSLQRSRDMEARVQLLETSIAQQSAEAAEREKQMTEREQEITVLAQEREEVLHNISARLNSEAAGTEAVNRRISEFGAYAYQTRAALSIQERRLALFLKETRKQSESTAASPDLDTLRQDEARHRYDSLYAAFEDLMRGSRDEIKARQAIYIDSLREQGIGSPGMQILDLGCGRGEWLEVLREHEMHAHGVDDNETMIERCRAFNLPVTQADALSYLAKLPDSSMGAVTAFHMVEHLPFEALMTLIDETLRVLKPGGIIILETPNPGNILVGATTFHFDPTHRSPLPSPMLRFFVEARGFCDVLIREMHPYPPVMLLPEDHAGVAKRFNEYFYGPQDYAVMGKKP